MRYVRLITLLILLFVLCTVQIMASTVIHGEILEIFLEENKIRILTDGQMGILELAEHLEVYRNGHPVELYAARPIITGKYQEGLFFLDQAGLVQVLIVDYSVEERLTDQGTFLIYYDIFGNVKEVEELFTLQKEFTY